MVGARTRMALLPVIHPEAAAALPPRHTHDCERCTYIGRADCAGESGTRHDVYVCETEDEGVVNLIARYGSQGDYGSFPLEIAAKVAEQHGGFWQEILDLHAAWLAGQRIMLGEK